MGKICVFYCPAKLWKKYNIIHKYNSLDCLGDIEYESEYFI